MSVGGDSISPLLRQLRLRALEVVAGSALGRRAIYAAIRQDPSLAFESIGPLANRPARFDTVTDWPEQVDGFDDLSFLFSSNPLNWGIALLMFDEASYLYGLARRLGSAWVAEIGRFKGGSTFVLASALAPGSQIFSYDLHVKLVGEYSGADLDHALRDALDPLPSESLDNVERSHILAVLHACGGNISVAAKRLGLHRRTLQRKLQKLPPAR